MRESVAECIYYVLENAMRKFVKRWADLQLLVLEKSAFAHEQLVNEVVSNLQPDNLQNVDSILLVDKDEVVQCYPAAESS